MKFADPRLLLFRDDILEIAKAFSLDSENLLVESYIPNNHAILVETVADHKFRIHVNLQEWRIVAAKELGSKQLNRALFEKYIEYMK
ncbi:MAG: hypothetical protein D6814_00190 [Calditrichaeota bacterium]|nr:MAG: hypothetical protein D6814_00190 [Calditrichota bacterium]